MVSATVTGMRVRAVRELGGRSRSEIARAAGLSRRDLAAVERGDRALSRSEAHAIADALDVDGDAFLAADELASIPRAVVTCDHVDEPERTEPVTTPSTPAPAPRTHERERALRNGIDDVLDACARVSEARTDDDVYALLRDLEATLKSTEAPATRR